MFLLLRSVEIPLPMKETRPHRRARLPSVRLTVARRSGLCLEKRKVVLAVAIDDAAALEVVRRELHADPVARVDANPEAAHLPGRVAERLVSVVERDPELAVAEGFDDLALELDLLFFDCYELLPSLVCVPPR
jgi:hypothetical protein